MSLSPEVDKGNAYQVLTGVAAELNDFSETILRESTADRFVRTTLLPTIAETDPLDVSFINRLKFIVRQWQELHQPEEGENSLAWQLASLPSGADSKGEYNIITLLAHTAPINELLANLSAILPMEAYWIPKLSPAKGKEWRDQFLVPMRRRFAAAVHERVAWALVPESQEEETVEIARKYLLEQNNASLLLDSLITTEPVVAATDGFVAGPAAAEVKGHIASTALLLTQPGGETSPDYDPEILFWSLALPESALTKRASLELGRRLGSPDFNHEAIYSLLRPLPLDLYHYNLWLHINPIVLGSISEPEQFEQIYGFPLQELEEIQAGQPGSDPRLVLIFIDGISQGRLRLRESEAQLEVGAALPELTIKMHQVLEKHGQSEESMAHLLFRLHWLENSSHHDIADRLQISYPTVSRWMQLFDIPSRDRLAASRFVVQSDEHHKKMDRRHKEIILQKLIAVFGQNPLYEIRFRLEQGASPEQLAGEVGVANGTFKRWLRLLDAPKPRGNKILLAMEPTYLKALYRGILRQHVSPVVIAALRLFFDEDKTILQITQIQGKNDPEILRQAMLAALRRIAPLLEK